MKGNKPVLYFIIFIAVVVILAFVGAWINTEDLLNRPQVNKMAAYLNEKYGYELDAGDLSDFIEEDYSSRESFIVTVHYDIPYVAVFVKDGKRITVTDRNGFLSDDGQMQELNGLLCGYFEELTGVEGLEYVDIRKAGNGNTGDSALGDILQCHFNEKLTGENIGEFMDAVWENIYYLDITFYFREAEDREQQLADVTEKLKVLKSHENLRRLALYTFTNEGELEVISTVQDLARYKEKANKPDDYVFYCRYVPNPHELHTYGVRTENEFSYHAVCLLGRGYDGGFGEFSDETFDLNGWRAADLSE